MASNFGNLSRLGLVCVLPGRRGGASCYNRGFVLVDRRQTRCYLETVARTELLPAEAGRLGGKS